MMILYVWTFKFFIEFHLLKQDSIYDKEFPESNPNHVSDRQAFLAWHSFLHWSAIGQLVLISFFCVSEYRCVKFFGSFLLLAVLD